MTGSGTASEPYRRNLLPPRSGSGQPPASVPQPLPERPPERPPARRRLQVYSFDPMLAQTLDRIGPATVTVGIPYEPLQPGPSGSRLQVIDFDAGHMESGVNTPVFYQPVDLEDHVWTLQDGLAPTEADPRFHQQMTYAVGMRVLEAFDRALGRRLRPRRGVIRIFPHAFRRRNAYYDPAIGALLFGYFEAERRGVGANLPGQMIYTCLSHDIIAHEMTHALVDRLRPGFMVGSNDDVAAFHEAFADIVAIFLHFTLPAVLKETIAATSTRISNPSPLVDLAQQFGYATGESKALRTAIDAPDPAAFERTFESHHRGSILVAAVFEAFLTIYQRRIADLLRLATGGSGVLPPGALPPDLVERVTREATKTADQIQTMCIRAFDYLPPVDVTFGDFLRALVTVDRSLFPDDTIGLRTALVDGFRRRGIYPEGVISLADASLEWDDRRIPEVLPYVQEWLFANVRALDPATTFDPDRPAKSPPIAGGAGGPSADPPPTSSDRGRWSAALVDFAHRHATELELDQEQKITLRGFHPTFLADQSGAPVIKFIVQFTQRSGRDSDDVRSMLPRGTTVIADERGEVRHIVAKPLPSEGLTEPARARAAMREERFTSFLSDWEFHDPRTPFVLSEPDPLRLDFAELDGWWWR
jgi:hypothetical protein